LATGSSLLGRWSLSEQQLMLTYLGKGDSSTPPLPFAVSRSGLSEPNRLYWPVLEKLSISKGS
jgi:hypothetical protein